MKTLTSILLLALAIPSRGEAAFELMLTGARAAALGGAALTLHGDVVAGTMNPAGLAGLRGVSLVVWSIPSVFGIDGLQRTGCSAGLALGDIPVAISASSLGLRGYKETSLALAAACAGSGGWSAGLRIRLEMLGIDGYGQTTVPALDAGCRCEIAPGYQIAALLTNITATRIGSAGEPLPVSLAIGCACAPGEAGATFYARCCQELLSPLEWDLGAAYAVIPELVLRVGLSSEPSLMCGGFGISLDPVAIEYGMTHHRQLGDTHHLSVSICLD